MTNDEKLLAALDTAIKGSSDLQLGFGQLKDCNDHLRFRYLLMLQDDLAQKIQMACVQFATLKETAKSRQAVALQYNSADNYFKSVWG